MTSGLRKEKDLKKSKPKDELEIVRQRLFEAEGKGNKIQIAIWKSVLAKLENKKS